jgi:protein-disulfide isomerase/uncharacterized membrane protein
MHSRITDNDERAVCASVTPMARPVGRVTIAAAVVGLFAAGVLSAGHLLNLPVPCGGSQGCASVAAHPSSHIFGIPIAYFGFAAYAGLLTLLGRAVVSRRSIRVAAVISGLGTLISAGLLVYSQTVIRATCPWCVVSGVAMTAVAVLTVRHWRGDGPFAGPRPLVLWGLLFVAALGIGTQAGRMSRAASAPPVPAGRLAGMGPLELVDPRKSLGPADAVVTVIVFADFWCPGCRVALESLLEYQRTYPQDVRVVYRHLPLWEIRGHETSRAAAALSEMAAERGQFWDFVAAVHERRRAPDLAGYRELMASLGLDPVAAEARLTEPQDPAIEQVLEDEALAEQLEITATPTFVLLVAGHRPVSATAKSLPGWLNSATVTALLAERQRARTR